MILVHAKDKNGREVVFNAMQIIRISVCGDGGCYIVTSEMSMLVMESLNELLAQIPEPK